MKKYFVVSCVDESDNFVLSIRDERDFAIIYDLSDNTELREFIGNAYNFSWLDPVTQLELYKEIVAETTDKMINMILRASRKGWGDDEEVTAKVIEELVKIKLGESRK